MRDSSLSIANPNPILTSGKQKLALALAGIGALMLLIVWGADASVAPLPVFLVSMALMTAGTALFIREEYQTRPEGIKNNGVWFKSLTARGVWGWLTGVILTGFYVCLYWYPELLGVGVNGAANHGLAAVFDPLSMWLRKIPANQWFIYGTFYTVSVLLMGWKFIYKYKHNRYQQIRTLSVMFFQLGFAFLIPALMIRLQQPELYFTYFWPLSYSNATPNTWSWQSQTDLTTAFFFFGLAMFFVGTPILTYFFGKRWYCSWVCGCGGLAETSGDPFRHLSDKSLKAWKIERWMIHSVLVFAVAMTALLWINVITGRGVLQEFSEGFYKSYSFIIGSVFSGVIGVGFYPIMGSRVWCRFGCPMAAWLGLWQKTKSKFRITVNGGQCISCGNCSTFCEMGIDVRHYAQRGQDIVRSSCVGCGICSAVCPRGVLRLEDAAGDISQRAQQTRTVNVKLEDVGIL
jgi:Pyruvate/2-oxoacid:ferredoxin oxidoreductase delta subunit